MKNNWVSSLRKYAIAGGLVLSLGLAVTGCKNKNTDLSAPEEASVSGEEPEQPEEPQEQALYGVYGLTLFEEDVNGEGVVHTADLRKNARTDDGYLDIDAVYGVKNGRIYLMKSLRDEEVIDFSFEGEFDLAGDEYEGDVSEGTDTAGKTDDPEMGDEAIGDAGLVDYDSMFRRSIVAVDLSTGKEDYSLELPMDDTGCVAYPEVYRNEFWFTLQSATSAEKICYNYELEETNRVHLVTEAAQYNTYYLEGLGFYFLKGGNIRFSPLTTENVSAADGEELPDTEQNLTEDGVITLAGNFRVDSLDGVFFDENRVPCAIVSGIAGNLKQYSNCIFRLDTGELVRIGEEEAYYYTNEGVLMCGFWYTEGFCEEFYTGDTCRKYSAVDTNKYPSFKILSDGKLLFYGQTFDDASQSATIEMEIFDGNTGNVIASTVMDLTVEEGLYDVYMYMPFEYEGENSIGFVVNNTDKYQFYRWDYQMSEDGSPEGAMVKSEPVDHSDAELPDLEELWDPSTFTPGECPEELSDLRERADRLEEKFGFRIYIADECSNIINGFAMVPNTDRESISQALDELERVADKYPEGFYRQLIAGDYDEMKVYLTSSLIGTGSDMLEYAGGFKTIDWNTLIIAMNIDWQGAIEGTWNHEIAHAIYDYICYRYEDGAFDDAWKELNPKLESGEDCYTYSYVEFAREETWEYIYFSNSLDEENAWFVDDYSLTYPTEDVARVFEYAMLEDTLLDYSESPHLLDKLHLFTDAIRKYFELPDEQLAWELY